MGIVERLEAFGIMLFESREMWGEIAKVK